MIEREFSTATVHQGYIEPHAATALWNNDGRVQVWCSTQGAFVVRDVVACLLDLPVSKVKVSPTEIGGGFGGKIPVYIEPVAALLSKKSGRPVKIVMTRREVISKGIDFPYAPPSTEVPAPQKGGKKAAPKGSKKY